MPEWLTSFFDGADISAWDLVLAALSLLGAWLLSRAARRGVRAATSRMNGISPQLQATASRVVHYAILLVGVGAALAFLGARTEPVLAAIVVVGVVVVLALRGIADNFGASVILQTRMPIRIGDEIEFDEWEGVVTEMNGRSVVLRTVDGMTVHVPNSAILAAPLVNHSTHHGRRAEVEVRLADLRPDEIDEAVLPAVLGAQGVHGKPAPEVLFTAVDPARTTLRVRFWHAPMTGPRTTSAVVAALGEALHGRHGAWVVVAPVPRAPFVPEPPV